MNNDVSILIKAVDQASKEFNKIKSSLEALSTETTNTAKKQESMSVSVFKGVASFEAMKYSIFGVANALKDMILASGNAEQVQVSFTTLTGSAEIARQKIAEIQQLAANTPFESEGLYKLGRQLLAGGFSADTLKERLTAVGNATSALGAGQEGAESIIRALSQIANKGKLSAEEMNQLSEVGINGFRLLAEQTGKTEQEIRNLSDKGLLKGKEAADLLFDAFQRNYTGAMDDQSQTLLGRISTLKDNIATTARTIGDQLRPIVMSIVETFIDWTQKITDFVTKNKELITTIIQVSLYIGSVVGIVFGLIKIFELLKTTILAVRGVMFLLAANPVILILTVIVGVVVFLIQKFGGLANTIAIVGQAFDIVWNGIVASAKTVANFFVGWLNSKITMVSKTYDFFVEIANKFGADFKKIGNSLQIKPFEPKINLAQAEAGKTRLTAMFKQIEENAKAGGDAINNTGKEIEKVGILSDEAREKAVEGMLNGIKTNAGSGAGGISKITNAIESATEKFTDLKNKATITLGELNEKISELDKSTVDKFNDLIERRKQIDSNYAETKKKLNDTLAEKEKSLIDLESKHKDTLTDINKSITEQQNKSAEATKSYQKAMSDIARQTADVQKKIKDLQTSFAKGETGDKTSVAEKVVAQETEAQKLRAEIAKSTDAEEVASKQAQLQKIESDLSANASFIAGIQAQINEVKRVNALGEIARAVEEYNTKRNLALQEYNEKKALYDQELVDLATKRTEETAQYNNKLLEIQGEITQLNVKRVQELANYNAKRTETLNEIADAKAKIVANDEEYRKKKENILKEIADLQESYIQKKADYEAQQLAITNILATAEKTRADAQASTTAKNIANIQREIDKYNELAKAMAMSGSATGRSIGSTKGKQFGGFVDKPKMYAFGGLVTGQTGIDKVPAMLSAGEVVLNASQQRNVASNLQNKGGRNVTINIGGNFYGNDKEFANKIGDQIMKEFVKHTAFESF